MALNLTINAKSISEQIAKTPQIIVEVEGIGVLFGTSPIFKSAKWDDNLTWDQLDVTWDGVVADEEALTVISFNKTTKSVSQQIRPDKSSSSSISTMSIELIDINGAVSDLFAFNNSVDQLGKKAKVYLSFEGASHPEDSIDLFFGFIDDFSFEAGKLLMSVSHPENLKRQSIFNQYQDNLALAITDIETTITVTDTGELIPTRDAITSYIQIEDEVMEVTSFTATTMDVVRGRLGTTASAHDISEETLSFLTLEGFPLDLALKVMLSDTNNTYFESDETIEAFQYVSISEEINNAIIFSSVNIERFTGLVNGDSVIIASTISNDGTYTVSSFGSLDDGRSYIIVEEALITETGSIPDFSYRSKYNVLSDGLSMLPDEVDIESFESISNIFEPSFVNYLFYIKETIDNAKEFLDKEVFFPQNLYGIPRKARSSVKFTVPPLSIDETPLLNTQKIKNPQKLSHKRTIHKFLYNSIVYKYNERVLEEKFLNIRATINTDSLDRIKVGNKPLKITSKGLRNNAVTRAGIDKLASRALDRYKFAATEIKGIELLYKDGFNLEVGDTILYGGADMQIPDPATGGDLPEKLYEISNKSINVEKGLVKLDIIESGFELEGRLGVFSPSSLTDTGSTVDRLIIKAISTSDQFLIERAKWNNLVGAKIRVRSEDYTFDEEATIDTLDAFNDAAINISPSLSSISTDYIIELADYEDQPALPVGDFIKLKYTFSMYQKEITSVVSETVFDVTDTVGLKVGQKIQVHSDDYLDDSENKIIQDITSLTITLEEALSFLPVIGYKMETKSLLDDGDGYLYL